MTKTVCMLNRKPYWGADGYLYRRPLTCPNGCTPDGDKPCTLTSQPPGIRQRNRQGNEIRRDKPKKVVAE